MTDSSKRTFRRCMTLLETEFGNFSGRHLFAQTVANLLPQFTLAHVRGALWRAGGLHMGKKSMLFGRVTASGQGRLARLVTIGDETMISGPLHIDLGASLQIGNRVHIGHEVMLITAGHEISDADERCGRVRPGPIVLEDGCWIAARVTVLPNVTIGRGAVVAAGAVVHRDVPPNTLVGGVPARVIRALEPAQATLQNDQSPSACSPLHAQMGLE
jgi:maltose O-acetyltransferase